MVIAGELKINDSRGLTRAVKFIKGNTATVSVEVSGPLEAPVLSLSRSDGLAKDIAAQRGDNSTYIFHTVGEGNWELRGDGGEHIHSVKISE